MTEEELQLLMNIGALRGSGGDPQIFLDLILAECTLISRSRLQAEADIGTLDLLIARRDREDLARPTLDQEIFDLEAELDPLDVRSV